MDRYIDRYRGTCRDRQRQTDTPTERERDTWWDRKRQTDPQTNTRPDDRHRQRHTKHWREVSCMAKATPGAFRGHQRIPDSLGRRRRLRRPQSVRRSPLRIRMSSLTRLRRRSRVITPLPTRGEGRPLLRQRRVSSTYRLEVLFWTGRSVYHSAGTAVPSTWEGQHGNYRLSPYPCVRPHLNRARDNLFVGDTSRKRRVPVHTLGGSTM